MLVIWHLRSIRNENEALIVPCDMRAGNVIPPPAQHWWRNQHLMSASRPEIPQDFRLAQSFYAPQSRAADFGAPEATAR